MIGERLNQLGSAAGSGAAPASGQAQKTK
jgi:hypothetical protein